MEIPYIVKRTDDTLYLQISVLNISGSGDIHFNSSFTKAGHNRHRKCM